MLNETTDEIINGLLAETTKENNIEEQEAKKFLERWSGIFREPFIPRTRVIFERFTGTIVDHTDPKLEPRPETDFKFSSFEPLKDVFVLFDGNMYKDGRYNPYWLCQIKYLKVVEK